MPNKEYDPKRGKCVGSNKGYEAPKKATKPKITRETHTIRFHKKSFKVTVCKSGGKVVRCPNSMKLNGNNFKSISFYNKVFHHKRISWETKIGMLKQFKAGVEHGLKTK
jgi:hypothetical protein